MVSVLAFQLLTMQQLDIAPVTLGSNTLYYIFQPLSLPFTARPEPEESAQRRGKLNTNRNVFYVPLYKIGPFCWTTPTYPVSSLSSRTAHSSAVSPASTKPAGISMVTISIGGRYCFCSNSSGPDGLERMVTMPTPSIAESERV